MNRLVPRVNFKSDHSKDKDLNRIVSACFDAGYHISFEHCLLIWQTYSYRNGIVWETLPEQDSDLLDCIVEHSYVLTD